jgi:hypothetical protein
MPPGHPESKMAEPPKLTRIKPAWSDVKAKVDEFDEAGLIQLVAELCSFRKGNQSFLHARVSPGQNSLDDFRKKVVNGWNVEDSSATNSDALLQGIEIFTNPGSLVQRRCPVTDFNFTNSSSAALDAAWHEIID